MRDGQNTARRVRQSDRGLTSIFVRQLNMPGRYGDGNGLYLLVDGNRAKRWLLRTMVHGRRRDIGLGSARLVSLAEAREKATAFRKIAREGGDPMLERRRREGIPTFAEAAETVHGARAEAWKNQKHADQWINTLRTYAFPLIGPRRIDQIEGADVLRVLSPIWLNKPETARRVRQRIGAVLDWAKGGGHREGDNPVAGIAQALPPQSAARRHFVALPYVEVPAFIGQLRSVPASETTLLAMEFLVLTAARTGEVIGARWTEIDTKSGLWTIPEDRMKAGRPQRVPLSARCLAILEGARQLAPTGEFIFPGRSGRKPLSNMAFLKVLERMKLDVTVHGFRSAFRDWASETTAFPNEVCEMALAHSIKNKTEAAYRRGDLLEKRRQLMQVWADFACSGAG